MFAGSQSYSQNGEQSYGEQSYSQKRDPSYSQKSYGDQSYSQKDSRNGSVASYEDGRGSAAYDEGASGEWPAGGASEANAAGEAV